MVMKSSEDGHRYDAAHVLDGAMDRSVLVESAAKPRAQKLQFPPRGVGSDARDRLRRFRRHSCFRCLPTQIGQVKY